MPTTENNPVVWMSGASSCLGQAIMTQLRADGFRVVAIGRRPVADADHWVEIDFTANPDWNSLKNLPEPWNQPTAVVHAAGFNPASLITQCDSDICFRVLEVNITAAMQIIRCALPSLLRSEHAAILVLSSLAASHPLTGQTSYAAAKGALESLVRALAREWGTKGLRCNALAPGFIDSPTLHNMPDKLRQSILQNIPLRRWGKTTDIAAWTSFLLSPRSSYIQGQTIHVDGGMH